jgi:phosphatidylglycerol:prolipoprotein diacylglycerol transferase
MSGIAFPHISPVIFSLGFFELRWYSLAYLFGIIGGWLYVMYLNKRFANSRLTTQMLDNLPLFMVLSIVLGGRLGYVFFYNFDYYIKNLHEVFMVWQGGMSFHGGLIGVILGMFLFAKKYKIKFFEFSDLIAAATPIGLFLGRIANFINAELYGRITDAPWGVIFPNQFYARHPSQLYEAALEGIVLFVILMITIFKFDGLKKTGLISGLFLLGYASARFTVEFFREPDAQIGYLLEYFTMGQMLCLPMFALGAWLVTRKR